VRGAPSLFGVRYGGGGNSLLPRMVRRFLLLSALFFAACVPQGGEPVTTTTTEASTTPTTETSTTSTTVPTTSTTTPTTTTEPLPELGGLAYEMVADDLGFPMIIMPWTDGASLVGFRDGRIHVFDGTEIEREPLVDLAVSTDGERGLLGLDTRDRDALLAHYSDPSGATVVAEVDLASGEERVLLTVAQPAANHNGGSLQFGPDGALYLGLGDGGGANDRFGHGQNTDTLLGGIVRIDPDTGSAELWSFGLRNPYRFWIDGEVFYIGDVGQSAYEEIDVVELRPEGYNFGWPITEGLHCFSPPSECDVDGITLPVVEIAHSDSGTCAVTGGVVYRGAAIPEFDGHYFYSDYCGGWLRSFLFEGGEATDERDWTDRVGVPGRVVSFGVDHRGEMYVLTRTAIRRIVPVR
jgi:glucose/arabinose dehydrogenase